MPQWKRTSMPSGSAGAFSRRKRERDMFRPAPCGAKPSASALSAWAVIRIGSAMFIGISVRPSSSALKPR